MLRFARILPIRECIVKSDLDVAEAYLVRAIQKKHFYSKYQIISKGQISNSPLRHLCPFIVDDIICVGGRLSNAEVSFDHKHPILLPKSDPFTKLLIEFNHKRFCHTGADLLRALLSHNRVVPRV